MSEQKKNKSRSRLFNWTAWLLTLSSLIAGNYLIKQLTSHPHGQPAHTSVVETGNSLPVEKLNTVFSEGRQVTAESVIEISYSGDGEQLQLKITAPSSEIENIFRHLETEMGLKLDFQSEHALQDVQGRSGGKPHREDTTVRSLILSPLVVGNVIGLIAAVIRLKAAMVTRTNEAPKQATEQLPASPSHSVPADQLSGKRAVLVTLQWKNPITAQTEPTGRSEQFKIPPQAFEMVLRAVEVRLAKRLPLTIHISVAFTA